MMGSGERRSEGVEWPGVGIVMEVRGQGGVVAGVGVLPASREAGGGLSRK